MMEDLKKRLSIWAEENFLKLKTIDEEDVFYKIEGQEDVYMLIYPKEGKLVDKDVCFILDDNEKAALESEKIKYILFEFVGRFYYTKLIPYKNEFNDDGCYEAHFNDFKFLGEPTIQFDIPFVNLGVHSQYELLNGSNDAELWAKKAKFLKQKAIGLCDKNTLGGTLSFQTSCTKEKIKYIIGETVTVAHNYDPEAPLQETNELKLYVQSEEGWQNLLQINRHIKVINEGYITEQELLKHANGLICVFSTNSLLSSLDDVEDAVSLIKKYKKKFGTIFYQIDSVEFFEDELDLKHLQKMQFYFKNLMDHVKPVLINDCYYVEKEMWLLKEFINKVSRKVHDEYSRDQYFKNLDETCNKLFPLFKDEEKFLELFEDMCKNTVKIADMCDFEIESRFNKLPVYENIDNPEKDNLDLFFELIEEGYEKKLGGLNIDEDVYRKRIERESEVIVNAGLVDYFLILWDVVKWCKESNIYVGPGRGSVTGSVICFFLNITTVDPIKHTLSFERFLSPERFVKDIFYELLFDNEKKIEIKTGEKIKLNDGKDVLIEEVKEKDIIDSHKIIKINKIEKSKKGFAADIDLDFETEYRDVVKEYIRERFGVDFVCSVGSYGTFKLKGAIKDFAKIKGVDFQKMNFITKGIADQIDYTFRDLLIYAQKSYELKRFLNDYPEIFHAVKYSLGQTKTSSIHASAMLIVPKIRDDKEANIFNWLPIRQENGLLVSEWEGGYTDAVGFLKEDILGLNQLDKLHNINRILKKNGKDPIMWENLDLKQKETYKYFQKGFNEDVFQFNSAGLKSYSIKVEPDCFEDITAMTALYRPGPILINAHLDFALLKHGKKKIKYYYGLEDITKSTYSLLVYQEQIMRVMNELGGFTLIEVQVVRDIIKKFNTTLMTTYENKFIQGAVKNGCSDAEAKKIWDMIVGFSRYAFNLNHSVAYTLMSYWSMFAKVNYPLEFWTTSLQYSPEDDIGNRTSELNKIKSEISLRPPDVNYSDKEFACDVDTNSIFWSINKIKGLGEASTPKIVDERKTNGRFTSIDNFKSRFAKKDVNKGKLLALILAGGFDSIEGINYPEQRFDLVKKHFESYGEELPEKFKTPLVNKRYWWTTQQRTLTGYGIIDFKELLLDNPKFKKHAKDVVDAEKFFALKDYDECALVGEVQFVNERDSKRGKWLRVTIMVNNDMIQYSVWSDCVEKYRDLLYGDCVGKMLIFTNGKVKFSEWQGFNTCNSTENTIIAEV